MDPNAPHTDFELTTFRNPPILEGTPFANEFGLLKPDHFECNLINGLPVGLDMPPTPHPPARSGHFMGYSTALKMVVLYGGMGASRAGSCFNDVWLCDAVTGSWSLLPTSGDIPIGSFGFAACLINNDTGLFIHGGMTNTMLANAHVLDLRTGVWTDLGLEALGRRWGHSAHLINVDGDQYIVLALGDSSHNESTNDIITVSLPSGKVMRRVCKGIAPEPRRRHAGAVLLDKFLLVFGGRSADTRNIVQSFFNDLWVLNMVTWEWCQLTTSVTPASLHQYYLHPKDRLLGDTIRHEAKEAIEDDLAGPLHVRTGAACTMVGSMFYTFGGFGASTRTLFSIQSLFRYNPFTNKWSVMESGLSSAGSQVIQNPHRLPPPLTMSAMCWIPPTSDNSAHLYIHGGRWRDDAIKLHYLVSVPRAESLRHFALNVLLSSRSAEVKAYKFTPALDKFIESVSNNRLPHSTPIADGR